MNTCDSNLQAVDHANKRGSSNMLASGVGGVTCARHVMNMPGGFGDLEKGEK